MKRITKIGANESLIQKKKLKVAAYCRVSTRSDEQLESLDAQKEHYGRFIKSNSEWEYAGLYYDEGISGTKKAHRDGLLTLMKDCERGLIDLVYTKSISRFSRNTTDCLELVRTLLDYGVFVYFEKENLNTGSMESELMLSVLSSLAESESVSISQNEKWGIQKRFEKGTYIIAYPPYGYENKNGEMKIVIEQAHVVKQIFADALAGKGTHSIAASLNARGIPSKRGGKWTSGISSLEDNTAITIKKEPRISVTYNQPADIQRIQNDIECIMQFFGLLIGKVSTADNIRLSIEGQKQKSWLYINHDYSYNLMNRDVMDRPRTYHYVLGDNLILYFSNWHKFCFDDRFTLLRRIYFSVNDRKEIFAEEIFVEYMRILDGYHTRISGDAEIEEKLNKALKTASKVIKTQIFKEDNRPIFEEAFQSVLPDWKYNSSNMGDISGWIAAGYLGRKSLSHRLKELDNLYFGIIKNNAVDIERLARNTEKCKNMTDDQIIELFYRELGDTRETLIK